MTARNQILYRVRLPDGDQYIIEDDWQAWLADNPQVDPENREQVIEFRGEDRLMTMTGQQAMELGMATGLADTLEELHAILGVEQPTLSTSARPKPKKSAGRSTASLVYFLVSPLFYSWN